MPPKDPVDWNIVPSTIYGCPLCYRVNSPTSDDRCYQVDSQLVSIKFPFEQLPRHGLTITNDDVSPERTVAIGVSMGHIYIRGLDPTTFDPTNYTPIESSSLTLTTEDLPVGYLYFHHGKFYSSDIRVMGRTGTNNVLIGLTRVHYLLERARSDHDQYRAMRNSFLLTLGTYLAPSEIKLDSRYGQQTVKMIIEALNFDALGDLSLERLDVRSTYGKIYLVQLPVDRLVFKYHAFESQFDRDVWQLERRNSEFINRNLDRQPNLPYPYTYHTHCCGPVNIEHLTRPTCPSGDETGLIVQQFIDNCGLMKEYANLDLFIEAMAVLAEAHQGDTVQYHFMHLDAHTGNFLVSECSPENRTCSLANNRTVNLGGLKYTFDTHGYRLFLIDFGLSHFLDDAVSTSYNNDISGEVMLRSELQPAYDFITLYRSGMHSLIESLVRSQVQGQRIFSNEIINHLTTAIQIGTAMIASQLKALASRRVHYRVATLTDCQPQSMEELSIYDLEAVVVLIHHCQLADLQVTLIQLVERLMGEVDVGVDPDHIDRLLEVAWLLTGRVQHPVGDWYYSDRSLLMGQLEPLTESSRRRLSIDGPVPPLTGIPLYLWYLRVAGIPIAE